jgi:urease accessory protein
LLLSRRQGIIASGKIGSAAEITGDGGPVELNISPALCPDEAIPLQRAEGEVRIGFKTRGSTTHFASLYQSGCAKARFPRVPGNGCEAVLINTAGGLTDGDVLQNDIVWEKGAKAVVTTQACERIYRSRLAPAKILTRLTVHEDAHAFWLPQETILFNSSRSERRMHVDLRSNARFTGCESVILGRPAMGETVEAGSIRDFWHVERDGKPIFIDRFAIDGALNAHFRKSAIGNGATAWATVVHAAPDAEIIRDQARELLEAVDIAGGCTDLGGLMVARLLADDGFLLRKALVALLELLCGSGYLPRSWTC